MLKWLILVLVCAAAFFIARAWREKRRAVDKSEAAESMVACHQCGINLPRSEAIRVQDRFFCCEQHRDLDAQ